MNTYTLLKLVQQPERASSEDLDALREEARKHPYFQGVRALIAKIDGSSEAIKTAAAYTANRGVLMRVINQRFNPDVNLPNIDHLDIQKDDINAFERLGKDDDDDFRNRLEALAEGNELGADEDDVRFQKDDAFDSSFSDFDAPAYDLDAPMTSSFPTDDEPAAPEGGFFADAPIEEVRISSFDSEDLAIASEILEETAPEDHIDDDLMASIAEMRRSRDKAMQEADEREQQQEEDATMAHSLNAAEAQAEEIEAQAEEIAEEIAPVADHAPQTPTINPEDDPDSGLDDEMRESLASLRRAKDEAMRNKAEAEARMAAMEAQMHEEKEEEKAAREKLSLEVNFPEPEYNNPFVAPAYQMPAEDAPAKQEPAVEATPIQQASKKEVGFFTERPSSGQAPAASLGHSNGSDDLFGLDAFLEEKQNTKQESKDFKHSVLNLQPFQEKDEDATDENGMTLEEKKKAQQDIINAFIANAPKIAPGREQPIAPAPEQDLSQSAFAAPQSFISENLASIMVRQGKYEQAIKIYQELMLKYPEKKSYFADLIENLQNKQ